MLFKDEAKAIDLARRVLKLYSERGWRLACAESCTGGLLSAVLTAIPGSSEVVERGFVTYSNQAKQELLGVRPQCLLTHGAVSIETALEMAVGALTYSDSNVAISITGIAGPGGGTADKPIGLVCFGWATKEKSHSEVVCFNDIGRDRIREASVIKALELLLAI